MTDSPAASKSFDGAFRTGAWDCFAAPGWGVFAAMTGFGALAGEKGVGLGTALLLCGGLWSMPGQVAYVELSAAGAGALAIVFAVTMANVRMLPLTIASIPILRAAPRLHPAHFLYAQLNSVTGYVQLIDATGRLGDRRDLAAYFVGFTLGTYVLGLAGTALGYLAADTMPVVVVQALVFVTPLYLLLLTGRTRDRPMQFAVAAGAVFVPAAYLVSTDWGLLAGGILAGTLAFAADRMMGQDRG